MPNAYISAIIGGGRKSLLKPVTWQNISSYSVLSPEIVMNVHDDAYIGRCSENNISIRLQLVLLAYQRCVS